MHLAFLCPAASGHVNPALPLVTELIRRGHRVSFATGRSMMPAVRASGAEPVSLPTEVAPPTMMTDTFTAADLAVLLEGVLEDQRIALPLLDAYFRRDPPDAVCTDMMDMTGRLLAHKLSVPAAALITSFAASPEYALTETFNSGDFEPDNPALLAVQAKMADFAAENGVADGPNPMSDVVAPLNLVFIPKEFQPMAETFDDRFRFIGPSLEERERDEQWQPRDSRAPVLFVSLGTTFNYRPDFFRTCVEAFGDGRWQVAMAVGDRLDPAAIGELPPNFEVRARFPQLAVLSQASVFLTHSGMGSTMESLYAGVPMVSAPQVPEQQANARRMQELGLGRVLGHLTAPALREAVDAVADDTDIRASIADMRRVVRSCGGAVTGADSLESYLGG